MAAKNENSPAEKSDLKSLDAELKDDIDRLYKAVLELRGDVREVISTMATKGDVDRILTAIDSLAKRSEHYNLVCTIDSWNPTAH